VIEIVAGEGVYPLNSQGIAVIFDYRFPEYIKLKLKLFFYLLRNNL